MSCKGCGPSKYSLEYKRRFKPENTAGCCVKASNDCDKPSGAIEGSPLWEWEQIHGRLTVNASIVLGENGRWGWVYEKVPCKKPPARPKRKICCSLRYKVTR